MSAPIRETRRNNAGPDTVRAGVTAVNPVPVGLMYKLPHQTVGRPGIQSTAESPVTHALCTLRPFII